MSKQYLQQMPTELAENHTVSPQQTQPAYVVHVHQMHWLSVVERLPASVQVTLAIAAGAGVPFAIAAVGGALSGALVGIAGIVAALSAFGLVLLNMFAQFALTVGAGIGIIALVVIGVTAISNIK